MRARAWPSWFFLLAVVLMLGACRPVTSVPALVPTPAPAPAPGASSSAAGVGAQSGCAPGSTPPDPVPTAAAPVEYVARVDEAGPGAPSVVTFIAASEAQRDAEVAVLDDGGDVVSVAPNRPVSAFVTPGDDPLYADGTSQYGLHAAHADFETAWSNNYDGTLVTIAIVDTGVLASHEDLSGRVDTINGNDFVDTTGNNTGIDDPNGHGTHVAGIAAASDNMLGGLGGAPGATILPVRVLNAQGSGSDADVALGIDWAVAHGADVINLSLGGPACLSATQGAIHDALAAGVVVVAAGGNCGDNQPGCPITNAAEYPAAGDDTDVIAVGATDSSDQRSTFSNYNPRRRVPVSWPKPMRYIDVAAPGTAVKSTYKPGPSTYQFLSGTSMATPYVAAAAALLLQKCPLLKLDNGGPGVPSATPAKIKAMLEATAAPVFTLGTDLGAGLIKVGAATALACPA